MSGGFLQLSTELVLRHGAQTEDYGMRLGQAVRQSEQNTADLYAHLGGEVYQANAEGHANWRQPALLRGEVQTLMRADAARNVSVNVEGMGFSQMHNLSTVNMPTA